MTFSILIKGIALSPPLDIRGALHDETGENQPGVLKVGGAKINRRTVYEAEKRTDVRSNFLQKYKYYLDSQ